ncbi:Fe-S-containing protein [Geobacter sp.]|uniref:Fe-S-containing protein n=1 Tax=Geobacter sp. TaxID=46610 RepID=UPI002639D48E|nr:Fe-S-containing protein [Geobacter sp.]
MLAYLVNFILAFSSLSLTAGMLITLLAPPGGKKGYCSLFIALACGVTAGAVAYPVAIRQESLTAVRTVLHAAALVAALLNGGAIFLPAGRSRGIAAICRAAALFFTALLAAVAGFSFSAFIAKQSISSGSVLNTELILNIGGVLAGLFLTASFVPLTAYVGSKSGREAVKVALLLISLLLAVQWSADILLGLMRLEMVELTSARVSVVAKVGKYARFFPYVEALVAASLSFVFFLKRTVIPKEELAAMDKAERRKVRSRVMLEGRWLNCVLASVLIVLGVLLYHDLYASRPPRISKPLNLKPDANGLIRVKIDDLADGNLHRYSHVTDDGHVVRFFMINRSGGKKIGVVYDACMMCGDMGYIQEKNEVICIACNVRIFVPSIGKAGGCNPIPLAHKVEGGYVVVSAEELDKGARYFSEVVTVKVKDPVSGREMVSRDAPQRYEYKGRTYFFESEETMEKFEAAPEKFIGNREARYFRVQGYRES